eukprot:6600881-Pyramimonas_sp.AAC.1
MRGRKSVGPTAAFRGGRRGGPRGSPLRPTLTRGRLLQGSVRGQSAASGNSGITVSYKSNTNDFLSKFTSHPVLGLGPA